MENQLRHTALLFAMAFVIAVPVITIAKPSMKMSDRGTEVSTLISADGIFRIRYPRMLLVCGHEDGENPDVWSPKGCSAELAVCDNSEHAGSVLACLAYPADALRGSEVEAAAFSVSRIENFNARDCVSKWASNATRDIHRESIAGLRFQAASAQERVNSRISEQSIYRIFHNGACYELDSNLTIALDSAFAVEDAPRKLSPEEMETIRHNLQLAVSGFRFLK